MQLAKRETVRDGKRTVPDFIDRAKLFELIIESATDFAIFTKDVDGAITSWSEQAGLGVLEWRKSGVVTPQGEHARHRGYGAELLTRALPYQLKAPAELIFGADDGVSCTIAIPVKTRGRSHD